MCRIDKGFTPKMSHALPAPKQARDVKLQKSIAQAFAEQFPPEYTRILTMQPETLTLSQPKNGVIPFSFTAKVSQGAFIGTIDRGTQKFTGSFDTQTGKVTFAEA